MKKPIPATIADFKDRGTASMMCCLNLVIVKIIKMMPEINTEPKAVCQDRPKVLQA